MNSTDFVVARRDFQECKFIETRLPDADVLPEEALLVNVERFAVLESKYDSPVSAH